MHTPALWEPQFINGRFVGVTENTDMNIDENRLSLNPLVYHNFGQVNMVID